MSLWQYFHHEYNKDERKNVTYIPYATGLNSSPTFPVSVSYAKGSLIKHCPWSKHQLLHFHDDDDTIQKFNSFIKHDQCPLILKLEYKRAKSHYYYSRKRGEPTNSNIDPLCGAVTSNDSSHNDNETECLLNAMNSFTRNTQTSLMYRGNQFDRGVHYDWDKRISDRDPCLNGRTWLDEQIKKHDKYVQTQNDVIIPTKLNASTYNLHELTDEQSYIAYTVLDKILEWLKFPTKNKKDPNVIFCPLRMTVIGKAGTGKSYLIHTLVTAIRKFTGMNDSVILTAPTGAAAYHINGHTIHSQFGLNPFDLSTSLNKTKKDSLIHSMKRALVLIVDERSMISSDVLAACERNISQTVLGGISEQRNYGGMPVILLIGDDSQLPPVIRNGKGKGAFHVLSHRTTGCYNSECMKNEARGIDLFKHMSQTVMELTIRKRQHGDNLMVDLLDDLETGEPSDYTASTLMALHLNSLPSNVVESAKSKSTYIFATHNAKNEHNCNQLSQLCNEDNPLACLKYQDMTLHPKTCNTKHYDQDSIPLATHFCIGARVAIKGKNIKPTWGLYNGAIGTVKEIVFDKNCSPNFQDLPAYVAVEMQSYNPPQTVPNFDPENPKV